MLGFHRRTRSLIPVKELSKYDALYEKVPLYTEELDDEEDVIISYKGPEAHVVDSKQVALIYLVFVAEAIMAATLEPQLQILSTVASCDNYSTTYLRSILASTYAIGGLAGIQWGVFIDTFGRRRIALIGVFGTACCCFAMMFAEELIQCALVRLAAGVMSSAIIVSVNTMLGDISSKERVEERAKLVSRLPLVAVCGAAGPTLQAMLGNVESMWNNQIICGSLVAVIGIVATIMLKETRPSSVAPSVVQDPDSEKCAFMGQVILTSETAQTPIISVVDMSPTETNDQLSVREFLRAPSVICVLCALSILNFQASAFESLLFQTGTSGPLLTCFLTNLPKLVLAAVIGCSVSVFVPHAINKFGVLSSLRYSITALPLLCIATPVLVMVLIELIAPTSPLTVIFLLFNQIVASSSSVVIAILILNMSPTPSSTGTLVGLTQVSSLFRALGCGTGEATLYVEGILGGLISVIALWVALGLISVLGVAVAWRVREGLSLDTDLDVDSLGWEVAFEYDFDAKDLV